MYENLRARYAAERAAYHRDLWPDAIIGSSWNATPIWSAQRVETDQRQSCRHGDRHRACAPTAMSKRCWCGSIVTRWFGSTARMCATIAPTAW